MSSQTTPLPPEIIDTRCATCRDETEHDVLKGKVVRGGLAVEGTFRCRDCATTHSGLVTFPVPLEIPFIVSLLDTAEPHSVQVFEDDQVAVGDEFEIDESLVEVTAIELKDEARRVRRARAPDIKTLWGKNIDFIRVAFSINLGSVTQAFEADFGPEDEISIGEEFEYEGGDVIVERIITNQGKRFRGTFNVRDIKRVWLRPPRRDGPPPRPKRDGPHSQKEQRQANRKAGSRGGPSSKGPARSRGAGPSRGGPTRGPSRGAGPSRGSGPSRGAGPSRGSRGSGGRGPSRGGGSSRGSGGSRGGGGSRRGPSRR